MAGSLKRNRKEVQEAVDKNFETFWKDVFEMLKKHGYPDLKALGLAQEVSKYIKKVCKGYDADEIASIASEAKQYYIKSFQTHVDKKTNLTSSDVEFYAGEAFASVLTDVFEIDMSIPSYKIWPGCFGRSAKKEKF